MIYYFIESPMSVNNKIVYNSVQENCYELNNSKTSHVQWDNTQEENFESTSSSVLY